MAKQLLFDEEARAALLRGVTVDHNVVFHAQGAGGTSSPPTLLR